MARSLAKRDGFDAVKSYLLWTGHVLAGLRDTAGNKRVLVDYDVLMHSPVNEVKRIADRLKMPIDPQGMSLYATSFLDPSLRHSTHTAQDLDHDTACPALIREIYTCLLDTVTYMLDIDDPSLAAHIERWIAEYNRLTPILNMIDTQAGQINAQAGQINHITHHLSNKENRLAELENALTKSNSRAAALENALTESNSRAAALENALTESNNRVTALTDELQAILGSNSWTMTKPLRFIRHIITRAS